MTQLRFKAKNIYGLFSLDKNSTKFKRYIKKEIRLTETTSRKLVMIEFQQSPENVLALTIFLPVYRETSEANVAAYQVIGRSIFGRLVSKIEYQFSTTRQLIGKRLISINPANKTESTARESEWKKIVSKEDLEQFEYRSIHIGDLIYDEYLSRCNAPTVNLRDERLIEIFFKALNLVDWWFDFSKRNDVEALIVSHEVYLFGVSARIFISLDIPVYLVSTGGITRLSADNQRSENRVLNYPSDFEKIAPEIREQGLALAEKKLNQRLQGVGDLYYMPLVAFGESKSDARLILQSKRKKLLIAAHDFYDSPHGGGTHFYPDFYEWIDRLGQLANETDYDWYIKTHPFLRGRGREILSEFVEKYPKLVLLPSSATHNQIISEGIDVALTVYGTIATEYPLLGVPVLNASAENPHRAYRFSVTPKDREQYEQIIKNLHLIPTPTDLNKIYEYYFMHHLSKLKNWVFSSDEKYKLDTGYGLKPMTRNIYSYYLETENRLPRKEVESAVRNFLKTGDDFINREHFSVDFHSGTDKFW